MQANLRSATAEETRGIGEAFATHAQPGDVVILTGDLGAGKTTFVQGVARGLDVSDPVSSPTFTLVHEYSGRLEIAHVDVYRLERVQEVVDLALEELGGGRDVLLVEWGDAIEQLLPEDRLRVELVHDDEGAETSDRRVLVEAAGESWTHRWSGLVDDLAPWRSAT
jgi:tRNA threonylcarbamoyladenosine biosynthesis protein TsaE